MLNSRAPDRKERIGKIYRMHANKREEIASVGAGDRRGDGLKTPPPATPCATRQPPVVLESMTFPAPVIEVAIEPKTKGDQDKMGTAIQRLAEEDPTFQVHSDEETGQTIIAGMGELHLRSSSTACAGSSGSRPTSASRRWPTARRSVQVAEEYTHKKQTGGSGQFAKVIIALEPNPIRVRGPRRERLRVRQQGHRWPHPRSTSPGGRRAPRRP